MNAASQIHYPDIGTMAREFIAEMIVPVIE